MYNLDMRLFFSLIINLFFLFSLISPSVYGNTSIVKLMRDCERRGGTYNDYQCLGIRPVQDLNSRTCAQQAGGYWDADESLCYIRNQSIAGSTTKGDLETGDSSSDESQSSRPPEDLGGTQKACTDSQANANSCCTDLSSGECEGPGVADYMSTLQTALTYVQHAANISSIQASCQANKKILQLTNVMSAAAIGICTKQIFDCTSSCNIDYCQNISSSNTALQEHCDKIKKARRDCQFLSANVTMEQGLQMAVNKARIDAQSCENQALNDTTEDPCEDEEQANNNPACIIHLCNQPGAKENNPLCFDANDQANDEEPDGQLDIASTGDGTDEDLLDNPPDNPFEINSKQTFNGLDPSQLPNDSGAEGGAPTGGASALPGGAGGGAAGGSGGTANAASRGYQKTKDGKIIRGSGSGKGFISRFKGSGGGGSGYAGRRAGAGGSGRSLASSPKFNLENFLPKGKPIKKGPLKGFTRFPNGQLMVPQSKSIFEVHHQSYINACSRNQAIKGCEFNRQKSLGFQTLNQLNQQYKTQLVLQKESKLQRLSRSGIKVKSLKNDISKNARETYYIIQYMKKNRLQRVPAKDPYDSLSKQSKSLIKYDKSKYAHWHKMKNWIAQQNRALRTQPRNLPHQNSQRLPASSHK